MRLMQVFRYFGDISVRLFRRMPLESAVDGVSVRRQGAKPDRERERERFSGMHARQTPFSSLEELNSCLFTLTLQGTTLPESNIGPENGWLEYEFPFWDGLFLGAMLVSGSVTYPTKREVRKIMNSKVPLWLGIYIYMLIRSLEGFLV